ncbi:MAG: LacI family transcriptional regulator [Betaproteobacteria bacterium]|nr:LacI family transcriptional regulator [Betaproteobacteria bacterium]
MSKPAAKLIDVARLAGVCNATVSRALAREPTVSAEMLKRVEAAARELGYVPHGAASALRARRSRTVGAVLPTLDNMLYAKATHALQKALDDSGYMLLLACHDFDLKNEIKVVRSLIERGIDGLVLIGAEHDDELHQMLDANKTPYLLTWALDGTGLHPCVGFDNRTAAMRVANYLLDIGHRDFAMISGVIAGNDRARKRVAGVRDALHARGLELPSHHLIETPFTLAAGREAMQTLLTSTSRPSAVICGNDVMAVGAVSECLARSIDVPGEISVTGFDDMEAASILSPALTTVRVPMRELGYAAAQQILAHIGGKPAARVTELAVDLIVRGTTAPPRAGRR